MTSTGIDELIADSFKPLIGRRIGLITNHTGIDSRGRSTIDILSEEKTFSLKRLFSPEHGLRGEVDEPVDNNSDPRTGLSVISLYGSSMSPSQEDLIDIDTLVFDIQDVGTRFYTYISTLGLCMEASAKAGKSFLVLDRPNPIGGMMIEGPLPDSDSLDFTAYHSIPVRHGMTIGEMALLFTAEKGLSIELSIVRMEGWRRGDFWDATELLWINPSPNMRSFTQALLYPGIGLLEFTNVSVGRGTDTPFEKLGAPWIDGRVFASELNRKRLNGIRFIPVRFLPQARQHAGLQCEGVQMLITDRDAFHPVLTGLTIAECLRYLYPEAWDMQNFNRLLACKSIFEDVKRGATGEDIIVSTMRGLEEFLTRMEPHLLYNA